MSRIEVFLSEFCEIEGDLRKNSQSEKFVSFVELVRTQKKYNRVIDRYSSELELFAKLRNILSHDRLDGNHLAEPSEETVDKIKLIGKKIRSQPKLINLCKRKIYCADETSTIQNVLLEMRRHNFSQVPVKKGAYLSGVLSVNTVSRWLASNTDIFCTSETSVKEVMSHQEFDDNFEVLSKNDEYGKVVAKYEKYSKSGKQLDAIIVTENGDVNQKILGIVTMSDMPKILDKLY